MDWIHCNKCYLMPNMNQSRFLITNCAHVYCEACVVKGDEKTICHVCSAQCRTMLLASNLPENTLAYFRDPWESFKQSLKVMEFQKSQTDRLLKYFRKVMPRVQNMMKGCQQLSSELGKCKAELERYRLKERALQEMLSQQQKQLVEMSAQLAGARHSKSPSHCSPYFLSGPSQRKMQDNYSPFKIPARFDDSCVKLHTPVSGQSTPRSGRLVTSTTGCSQSTFANLFRAK